MKYLKRFNEELKPYTYAKAARKLDKKGGYNKKDRAPKLHDYSNELYWKQNLEDCKNNGIIKLELNTGFIKSTAGGVIKKENYIGEFHPQILIGMDMFEDEISEMDEDDKIFFTIFISAVSTTKEGMLEMENSIYEFDKYRNGDKVEKYRGMGHLNLAFLSMRIDLMNNIFEIYPMEFERHDDTPVEININILDRKSSGVIRNAVIKEFKDDEQEYTLYFNNNKTQVNGVKDAIEAILSRYGVSSEYGITFEDIEEKILKTTGGLYAFHDHQ